MVAEEIGILQMIRDLRIREPFVPFRVTMTSGQDYLIENSELLAIAKSQLIYCLPSPIEPLIFGLARLHRCLSWTQRLCQNAAAREA